MLKNKLLLISLLTIILIATFHYFSIQYSWYWTYRWLDIPVHIVGGFWVSLSALWVSLHISHIDSILGYKRKALLVMLISVIVIAILWEVFELISHVTSLSSTIYWQDTLSDISNGFVGGIISFLYFIKNKSNKYVSVLSSDSSLSMVIKH